MNTLAYNATLFANAQIQRQKEEDAKGLTRVVNTNAVYHQGVGQT